MTQYVDVLKKAIASLPSDTLAGRTQLYSAARGALSRQLQNNTNVPQLEKDRQLEAFENAVSMIEAGYDVAPEPASEPELEEAHEDLEPTVEDYAPYSEPEPQPSLEPSAEAQPQQPLERDEDHDLNSVHDMVFEPEPEPEQEPEIEAEPMVAAQPIAQAEGNSFTQSDRAMVADDDDIFGGSTAQLASNSDDILEKSDLPSVENLDDEDVLPFGEMEASAQETVDNAVAKADDSLSAAISTAKSFGAEKIAATETFGKETLQTASTSLNYGLETAETAAKDALKTETVADFGLKSDNRSRLAPHGDKDAALIHGSSLAKSGLSKVWIALAVVLLLAGGTAAAYFGRDDIAQLFAKDTAPASKTAEQLAADRLNAETNGNVVDKVVTSTPIIVTEPTVRPITPETVTPDQSQAPDPVAQQLAAEQAQAEAEALLKAQQEAAEAEAIAKAAQEAEAKAAAELAQQNAEQLAQQNIIADAAPTQLIEGPAARGAALYEESPDDPNKELAWAGNITWETLAEVQPDGFTSPAIVGKAEVPGRGMTVTITIRRNADASFDASHTVDLEFTSVEGENLPSVQDVGAVLLKEDEPSRGEPLAAGKAKVTEGYFLFALGSAPEVKTQNVELMKSKDWFDIPVLFSDNRRAIVVLNKGFEGKAVFDNALAAWARLDGGQ